MRIAAARCSRWCWRAAVAYAADTVRRWRKARALYNAGDYDGAIAAAGMAARAEATAVRCRRAGRGARAPRTVSPRARTPRICRPHARRSTPFGPSVLSPRDQVDLLVGLGQSLYLSGSIRCRRGAVRHGARARRAAPARDRLLLLDWWATALDREAQAAPPDRRARVVRANLGADGRRASPRPWQRTGQLLAGGRGARRRRSRRRVGCRGRRVGALDARSRHLERCAPTSIAW